MQTENLKHESADGVAEHVGPDEKEPRSHYRAQQGEERPYHRKETTDRAEPLSRDHGRYTSEFDFEIGLGAEWADVLKTIRDKATVREMKTEREFRAATKAMLAQHKMRMESAMRRVRRELEEEHAKIVREHDLDAHLSNAPMSESNALASKETPPSEHPLRQDVTQTAASDRPSPPDAIATPTDSKSEASADIQPPPLQKQQDGEVYLDNGDRRARMYGPQLDKFGRYKRLDIHPGIRLNVMFRDQRRCTHRDPRGERCPETRNLEIHHVLPVSSGGTNEEHNLVLLCKAHHRQRHPDIDMSRRRETIMTRMWTRQECAEVGLHQAKNQSSNPK